MEQKTPVPSLYDWAGGKEALENLTKVFYAKVFKDDLLSPVFKDMSAGHTKHVAHFIAEVFGGPKFYTEDDNSSHAKMIAHHLGRMLDEPKRKRWMQLLLESADEVGLANDPEFRSALVGYLEWGSRLAVINSNTNENPVNENEPMPKWGWGETGGPYIPGKTTLPILIFLIYCISFSFSCTSKKTEKNKTLFLDNVNIVDLTHTLNAKFPYIPTDVTYGFEIRPIATFEKMGVAANEWKIHEHVGTQFDAPNHFIKGGMSAEQIDVSMNLLVPAIVIDISDKAAKDRDAVLTIEDILNWEKQYDTIPQNAAVLMYSGWDKKINSSEFIGMDSVHKKHFPGISKEAADFLVNKRSIAGVGVDVVSFDPGVDDTYQTHRIILGKGKWALECLTNLSTIPATGAYVFVGAPKVEGATGGLSRVIAIW